MLWNALHLPHSLHNYYLNKNAFIMYLAEEKKSFPVQVTRPTHVSGLPGIPIINSIVFIVLLRLSMDTD